MSAKIEADTDSLEVFKTWITETMRARSKDIWQISKIQNIVDEFDDYTTLSHTCLAIAKEEAELGKLRANDMRQIDPIAKDYGFVQPRINRTKENTNQLKYRDMEAVIELASLVEDYERSINVSDPLVQKLVRSHEAQI